MTTLAPMRPAYGAGARRARARRARTWSSSSADVSNSDFSWMFAEAFPDRFLNVGIAEQSLVDVAVGLAYTGYVPFANTFAFLFATRALEMVRTHCCYGGAPVKLMGAYCGVSDSFDGPTHHSITDIAIMRALPGMTIVVAGRRRSPWRSSCPRWRPGRDRSTCASTATRCPSCSTTTTRPRSARRSSCDPVRDVTLVGTGLMLSRCLEAAEALAGEGIDARVLEIHTIKPLDEAAIVDRRGRRPERS